MKEIIKKIVSLKWKLEHRLKNIIILAEIAKENNNKDNQYYQSGRHDEVEKIIIELEKILNKDGVENR